MNLFGNMLVRSLVEKGIQLAVENPQRNLSHIIKCAETFAGDEEYRHMASIVKKHLTDTKSNWYEFAIKHLEHTDPNIAQRVLTNLAVHASLLGLPRRKLTAQEIGMQVPWAILMDPTENCNMGCTGCWAGGYQKMQELDLPTMDRVCSEAEEMGIYFIVLSGGEPLLRWNDIARLAEQHPNQLFHIFTNGTLITADMIQDIKRLGNIILALSIDGLEMETDLRRGKGVFKKLMDTMDLLRENRCLFGVSTTYTRDNTEELSSDEFVDLLIKKGAALAWYFTYIPIGRDVDLNYMATPEQRKYIYERLQHFRKTKPIFTIDFWNDGEATEGCIAGGRNYFHINAAGEVEPCAFIHYSTCNIKDISLKEALQNPLFKAFQERQPFNANHRCPCPLIDNPNAIREIVWESGAYSTQQNNSESIDSFAAKMQKYAEAWGRIAKDFHKEDSTGA